MSTGHLRYDKKAESDLYKVLGEGDTPKLYAKPVKLDVSHTVAYGGGVSVDGKTVYIDAILWREVMDGKVRVKGMSADQIIQAWVEHEHSEKAIDDGDNAVDVYQPAHEFATAKEHHFVKQLGLDPDRYEAQIGPALKRCIKRPQTNPPRDLWCGPYLDHPDADDREILRQFRARGVADAFKKSKFDVHYSIGEEECRDCKHFGKSSGPLRECEYVAGLVRETKWCDDWEAAKGK